MKILQVSNRVPWPLNEGGNIGIYNYTRAFSEQGHEITLYCLDALKHDTPIAEAQHELSKYARTYIHPINTDLDPRDALRSLLKNRSYNVDRFYNGSFQQILIELLEKEKFDVVQLEGSYVGPYVDAIRDHHKGLLSLRMHNAEFEIWDRLAQNEANPVKKLYLQILARQLKRYEEGLLKKVDLVIPVTDDDGEKFSALVPGIDCHTIPAGIDLHTWRFTPTTSVNRWYHIGSMEWHANREAVDWFVNDIHQRIASDDPEYRLHLAGKGIQAEHYARIAQVIVEGVVNNAFDFVKQLDVCVVPLKSGSGIRLKILEAMAAGKLVVSTTIGAQGIDYTANEHLIIANTPAEFKARYDALRTGSINAEKIVKQARELIEQRYSTEALAKELIDLYQQKKRA